jgi:hypothetical protein
LFLMTLLFVVAHLVIFKCTAISPLFLMTLLFVLALFVNFQCTIISSLSAIPLIRCSSQRRGGNIW